MSTEPRAEGEILWAEIAYLVIVLAIGFCLGVTFAIQVLP